MKIFAVSPYSQAIGFTLPTGVTIPVTPINYNLYIGVSNASAVSVILPAPSAMTGYCVTVKDQGGNFSTSTCAVSVNNGSSIDNVSSYKLTQKFQAATFFSDGSQYWSV